MAATFAVFGALLLPGCGQTPSDESASDCDCAEGETCRAEDSTCQPSCTQVDHEAVISPPERVGVVFVVNRSAAMEDHQWVAAEEGISRLINSADPDVFEFGLVLFPGVDAVNEYTPQACVMDSGLQVPLGNGTGNAVLDRFSAASRRGAGPIRTGLVQAFEALSQDEAYDERVVVIVSNGWHQCDPSPGTCNDRECPLLDIENNPELEAIIEQARTDHGTLTMAVGAAPQLGFGNLGDAGGLGSFDSHTPELADVFPDLIVPDPPSCFFPNGTELVPESGALAIRDAEGNSIPQVDECWGDDWVEVGFSRNPFSNELPGVELCWETCVAYQQNPRLTFVHGCDAPE